MSLKFINILKSIFLRRKNGIGKNLFFVDEYAYPMSILKHCETLYDLEQTFFKRLEEIGEKDKRDFPENPNIIPKRYTNGVIFGAESIKWFNPETCKVYSSVIESLPVYIDGLIEDILIEYFIEDLGLPSIPREILYTLEKFTAEKCDFTGYPQVISIEESQYPTYTDFIIVVNSVDKLRSITLDNFHEDLFKFSEKNAFADLKDSLYFDTMKLISSLKF